MPAYAYKARDTSGKSVKGLLEAATEAEVTDKLFKMGYMTTEVAETMPSFQIESLFERFQRIRTEDFAAFNIQLSNFIHAGISLLQSLHTLALQIENKRLKQTVEALARSLEAGASLSEALAAHPRVFSKLFINLVKAGEVSGQLDQILKNYAVYLEEQAELEQKIKGALFYPTLLLFAGVAVMLFIVTFIIPQFAEIFMKVGIPLPTPTLILYRTGMTIKQFWFPMMVVGLAGGFGLRYFFTSTSYGKLFLDRLSLKLPLIGPLLRKADIARFTRTLGMLVASGVPILQALGTVRDVMDNVVLAEAVAQARLAVEKGERISESLRLSGEFPPDAIHMIAVGEETGNLDEMLRKIAGFYDRATQYTIKKLTTLVEPLLLIVMGSLIGFIMASMLLPMFDMIKVLRTARAGF